MICGIYSFRDAWVHVLIWDASRLCLISSIHSYVLPNLCVAETASWKSKCYLNVPVGWWYRIFSLICQIFEAFSCLEPAIPLYEKVENLRLSIVECVFLICSVSLYAGSDTRRVVEAVRGHCSWPWFQGHVRLIGLRVTLLLIKMSSGGLVRLPSCPLVVFPSLFCDSSRTACLFLWANCRNWKCIGIWRWSEFVSCCFCISVWSGCLAV